MRKTKVNNLLVRKQNTFLRDGGLYILRAKARLENREDERNQVFSITGSICKKYKNGNEELSNCKHIREDIEEYIPEFAPFVALHGSTFDGVPFASIYDAMAVFNNDKEEVQKKLRISEEEYEKLDIAKKDEQYFVYLLYSLGIVGRWKQEAEAFISYMEKESKCKWENPYTDTLKPSIYHLTKIQKDEIRKKIEAGYYTKEAILKREETEKKEQFKKRVAFIEDMCKQGIQELIAKKNIEIAILECDLDPFSAIYYPHLNELKFNWDLNYHKLVPQEAIDRFIEKADYSKLQKGLKIINKECEAR